MAKKLTNTFETSGNLENVSSNGFGDENLEKQIFNTFGDEKVLEDIENVKGFYSTNDVMGMIRKRRGSNFNDFSSGLLSTDVSKVLLKQFKNFYVENASLTQDTGFNPLDNKLAKLLILSNGYAVRDYYKIGVDATEEELIMREQEFQDIWNNSFFDIGIKNPGKIRISHKIEGDKYISITKWDNNDIGK